MGLNFKSIKKIFKKKVLVVKENDESDKEKEVIEQENIYFQGKLPDILLVKIFQMAYDNFFCIIFVHKYEIMESFLKIFALLSKSINEHVLAKLFTKSYLIDSQITFKKYYQITKFIPNFEIVQLDNRVALNNPNYSQMLAELGSRGHPVYVTVSNSRSLIPLVEHSCNINTLGLQINRDEVFLASDNDDTLEPLQLEKLQLKQLEKLGFFGINMDYTSRFKILLSSISNETLRELILFSSSMSAPIGNSIQFFQRFTNLTKFNVSGSSFFINHDILQIVLLNQSLVKLFLCTGVWGELQNFFTSIIDHKSLKFIDLRLEGAVSTIFLSNLIEYLSKNSVLESLVFLETKKDKNIKREIPTTTTIKNSTLKSITFEPNTYDFIEYWSTENPNMTNISLNYDGSEVKNSSGRTKVPKLFPNIQKFSVSYMDGFCGSLCQPILSECKNLDTLIICSESTETGIVHHDFYKMVMFSKLITLELTSFLLDTSALCLFQNHPTLKHLKIGSIAWSTDFENTIIQNQTLTSLILSIIPNFIDIHFLIELLSKNSTITKFCSGAAIIDESKSFPLFFKAIQSNDSIKYLDIKSHLFPLDMEEEYKNLCNKKLISIYL
ncbi:Ras GTPase [Tieghemostelium lacteum]|uniref:Ras GTPase n=1 Tax=Tieghemostelium lacteum TaxID=361077 RepID=A0A151Z9D8_TIELA|nr:Ras GTPase [Tieghemostelium lacteum]|eukprot:KYQ90557.1 Ras GTPase [Tieghemostelium lacteum]